MFAEERIEMKNQHPEVDTLGLRDKIIGLSPSEKYKYKIESFSFPSHWIEWDDKQDRNVTKVGYVIKYTVKFNFKYAGRKAVTFSVKSTEFEGQSEVVVERVKKTVINFLEKNAEEILAVNIQDTLLPWDEEAPQQ